MKVRISKAALAVMAQSRPAGYVEDVLAVAAADGEFVTLPGNDYRRLREKYAPHGPMRGPGTELKSLLGSLGLRASPGCKCNQMALRMNLWGPDECLNHIEEIVDVMEEEAKKRKLPFLRTAGRVLVRRAISNARRKGNSQ